MKRRSTGGMGMSKHRKSGVPHQRNTRDVARPLNQWADEKRRQKKRRTRWYADIRELFKREKK